MIASLERDEHLLNRWHHLHALIAAAPSERVEARGRDLFTAYSAPERHYHTLDHLEAMFGSLEHLDLPEASLPAVQLAVWYHDVVYNSRATDNEERSADIAREALTDLGWGQDIRAETVRLILLTKTHQTSADDCAGQLLLDADLAILGADWDDYERYARAIRQEYAWVTEEAFRAARASVLGRFLQRCRLFATDTFYTRFEDRARRNLHRELASLGG